MNGRDLAEKKVHYNRRSALLQSHKSICCLQELLDP